VLEGKYTLVKHFWISCAHSVPGAGKCERIHGHNYKVTFCIRGPHLDEHQMLIDFRDIKHSIEKKFDHHYLNEFIEFKHESPSTEKVAEVFYNIIQDMCQRKTNKPTVQWVEIEETNEVYARYEVLLQS
jgi:6-pyruvoyltetrahydropterin/6-carboxytetrahydropterin synthase